MGTLLRIAAGAFGPVLLVLPLLLAPLPVAAQESTTRLEIYPLQGGAVRYTADRVRREENGRVTVETVYRKPGGAPLQREVWVFQQDGLKLVSQRLTNLVSGQREDMELTPQGKVSFFYQENGESSVERGELEWKTGLGFSAIVGATITGNWDKLEGGGEVAFDFLVPSRQGTVGFRLRKHGTEQVSGHGVTVVRMEPGSWLIRKLVDPLYFYYTTAAPHRLVEFRGRSSLRKDDGKTQDLRTVYLPPEG